MAELFSLKELAQRRAIAHLWCDSEVLASISKFRRHNRTIKEADEEWRGTIELEIKGKVSTLNLPASLKKQMIELVRPIGLQVKRWKDRQDHHFRNESQEITLPHSSKLGWTRAGLVDYRKTAEELVRCDDLDVVLRYKLACLNCLEDDIPLLWEELPEAEKTYFREISRDRNAPSPGLHFCWPCILRGELSSLNFLRITHGGRNLSSFNQWAFEDSAKKGNKMATEYFFRKLTDGERRYSLDHTVRVVCRKMPVCVTRSDEIAEVFFFLLSVMTPEQRTRVFTNGREWEEEWVFANGQGWEEEWAFANGRGWEEEWDQPVSLWCFLEWPWPDLFLESIHNFWRLIPPLCYDDVCWAMHRKLRDSDFYLPQLFPKLFEQSPLDFKKRFVELEGVKHRFLHLFLKSDDSESIRSVLRNLDVEDTRLLYRRNLGHIFVLFDKKILAYKWQAVEVFLREFKLAEGAGETLKEIYMDATFRVNRLYFDEAQKRKFKRFSEYFDGTGASAEEVERVEEVERARKHKLKDCFVRIKRLCPGLGDVERPEM